MFFGFIKNQNSNGLNELVFRILQLIWVANVGKWTFRTELRHKNFLNYSATRSKWYQLLNDMR